MSMLRRAEDRLFTVALLLLSVCTLVPLWAVRHLPLRELPLWLDAVTIWHRIGDPAWALQRHYQLAPGAHWGYFFPVYLLAFVFSVEIANKIYLSLYALALVPAALALARRMGRSPLYALFAFPLVFNMTLAYGYLPFCAAIPLLLVALVRLDRFLEQPTRKEALALGAAALAVALLDGAAWLWLAAAALVLAGCHGWHLRRIAAALVLQLPAALLAVYAFRIPMRAPAAAREETLVALTRLPNRVIAASPDNSLYGALMLLGLIWLGLLLSARTDARDSDARQHGFAYRLELLALVALVAYFFFPLRLQSLPEAPPFSARFLPLAALLLALSPHGPVTGRRRMLMIPVCLIAFAYPVQLTINWMQFDQRAAGFRRLIKLVPPGSSTLTLIGNDGNDATLDPLSAPFLHYHANAHMMTGGFDPYLPPELPLAVRPGAALPASAWQHPAEQILEQHGSHYDYILTKAEPRPYAFFGPNDGAAAPLAGSDGDWRLYKVKHP